MAKECGYAGKIGNQAGQKINAIYQAKHGKGDKVIKGEDLRAKKSSK